MIGRRPSLVTRWVTRAVAGALVLVAAGGQLPVGAQPDGLEIVPTRYDAAELAAIDALDFDPWMIEDGDLVRRQVIVMANLPIQYLGMTASAEEVRAAAAVVEDAAARRAAAEALRNELAELLDDLVISTFVLSDDGSANQPRAEVDRLRRNVPLQAITADLIGELGDARDELRWAEAALGYAEAILDQRERELAQHEAAVERAQEMVNEVRAVAEARDTAIAERIEETLETEKPDYQLIAVEGFRVDASIAEPLAALLAAAREDGIEFGGWGWRSTEEQINLRREHCGTSGYALFDQPAGTCIPPTARPLHSQHEIGLAVDFTENGGILTWTSPGFFWLRDNAADHGFYNLPSEAWHWSTTGH